MKFASYHLTEDRKLVLAAISSTGTSIAFAPPLYRDDKEMALTAVRANGRAYESLSPRLKQDPDVAMAAVIQNYTAYEMLPQHFREDETLVEAFVDAWPCALNKPWFPQVMRDSKRVMLTAVRCRPMNLMLASEAQRNEL